MQQSRPLGFPFPSLIILALAVACDNTSGGSTRDAGGGPPVPPDSGVRRDANTGSEPDAGPSVGAPALGLFATVAVGQTSHSCAITDEGRAYCWGRDAEGQLGEDEDGDNEQEDLPVAVDLSALAPGTVLVSIDGGVSHTCALADDGAMYCWGADASGQLGDGDDGNGQEDTPVRVDTAALAAGERFITVSASFEHSCGTTNLGFAYCWGEDRFGQLGDGEPSDASSNQFSPVAVDTSGLPSGTRFGVVSTGSSHSCGLTRDGAVYCWGSGQFGKLGTGSNGDSSSPVPVDMTGLPPTTTFTSLTVGAVHSCAVTDEGDAYCWGLDSNGNLGEDADGDNAAELSPVLVDTTALHPGEGFSFLTAGPNHTCGLSTDRLAYCWGRDRNGALGEDADGDNEQENTPVLVSASALVPGTRFSSLAAAAAHTCALANDGSVYCWGMDESGQLGNDDAGLNLQQDTPVRVAGTGVRP